MNADDRQRRLYDLYAQLRRIKQIDLAMADGEQDPVRRERARELARKAARAVEREIERVMDDETV